MLNELKYVYRHFQFSDACSPELKVDILTKGYVDLIEGTYIVSALGEKKLGVSLDDDTDEDITECFIEE